MIRNAVLLLSLLISLAAPLAAQQDALVFFYRPDLLTDSSQNPTIYAITNASSRKLATIAKGEFFGLQARPGIHAFSWTEAPARGQQVLLNITAGQQAFVEVQFRSMTLKATGEAPANFQELRPIDVTRVFDPLVLIPQDGIQFAQSAAVTVPAAATEKRQAGSQVQQSENLPRTVQQQRSTQTETHRPTSQPAPVLDSTPVQTAQTGLSSQTETTARQTVSAPSAPESHHPQQQRSSPKGKEIKILGYVTAVNSATNFEIEDYRITRDDSFQLEFENASPDLTFKLENLRVGTELEIKGLYNEESGELRAKSIKVDMEQFRKLKQTAMVDRPPVGIVRSGDGWKGVFFADGQRIQVVPETLVVFKLTSREKKAVKEANKANPRDVDAESDAEFRPLSSLEEITPGMMMTYEGKRDVETGRIMAERVEFLRNDFEKGEEKLWTKVKPKVKPWNEQTFAPGQLSISEVGKFKLLPSDEVQSYVSKLGESLIPKYERDISDSDPAKLHFKFYVVIEKEPNAFALANGVFVINSGMFEVVESEAQLAAVIGHEIAHAVEEHTWRQMQYHKNTLTALHIGGMIAGAFGATNVQNIATLVEAAWRNGYSRSLENQADRVGLEYMVEAGYDPREAPKVWKQMTKVTGLEATNFFWSTHDNHATRRSYLMNEIKNNYSDLNYSTLRIEEGAFKRIAARVKERASGKRKIKVTGND